MIKEDSAASLPRHMAALSRLYSRLRHYQIAGASGDVDENK